MLFFSRPSHDLKPGAAQMIRDVVECSHGKLKINFMCQASNQTCLAGPSNNSSTPHRQTFVCLLKKRYF